MQQQHLTYHADIREASLLFSPTLSRNVNAFNSLQSLEMKEEKRIWIRIWILNSLPLSTLTAMTLNPSSRKQ